MKFRDLSACSTDILEAIEHLDEYGSEEEYNIIMSLCELRKKVLNMLISEQSKQDIQILKNIDTFMDKIRR